MAEGTKRRKTSKVFNDPIHGCIELHPLLLKIIDTPQFQRLRCIKQLGGGSYVYPGAVHTRFEHSIGVCHLAGELARSLRKRQEEEQEEKRRQEQQDKRQQEEQRGKGQQDKQEEKRQQEEGKRQQEILITEKDILCVEIAGLCHDLGHGPYSHMFEVKVIPRILSEKKTHEEFSKLLFDHMVTENNKLGVIFEDYNLKADDIEFIKDLFEGIRPDKNDSRSKKPFLYEIVANKQTGIDVDKFDYFARDCHMLGMHNNFDHKRAITMARVLKVNGQHHICFRDKEEHDLYDMFYTRYTLHRRAYQHRVVKVVERMITDAIVAVCDSPAITFKGTDKTPLTLKKAIEKQDLQAYCQMTDNIVDKIRQAQSIDPSVRKAQDILQRIDDRQLYVLVAEIPLRNEDIIEKDKMNIEKKEQAIEDFVPVERNMPKGTVIIDNVYFDYGKKGDDPLKNSSFYDKNYEIVSKKEDDTRVMHLLPAIFREQLIRIFCNDPKFEKDVGDAVNKWCEKNNFKKTAAVAKENAERTAMDEKPETVASTSKE